MKLPLGERNRGRWAVILGGGVIMLILGCLFVFRTSILSSALRITVESDQAYYDIVSTRISPTSTALSATLEVTAHVTELNTSTFEISASSTNVISATPENKYECPEIDSSSGRNFDTLHHGCLKHPSGMSLQLTRNVCIGHDEVILLSQNGSHHAELIRCCSEIMKTRFNKSAMWSEFGCDAEVGAACQTAADKVGGTALQVRIVPFSSVANSKLTFLTGNSYWLHTPNIEEHFGHQINRYLQLFNIKTEKDMPKIDRIVSRQFSPYHSHLRNVVEKIAGEFMEDSYFLEKMLEQSKRLVCMEKAWEPIRTQLEYVLHNEEQGEHWRSFATESYKSLGYVNTATCPPPRAVILQRTEGTGRRRILNYDVVDRVFAQMNMTYSNVTIASNVSSHEQIELFNSFGMMVAPHSSQLKNLIFAANNSIVIEARGTPWGYMQPSPFSLGVADPLHVHFIESLGHRPDYSSCPESHGCRTRKLYKTDFWLDENQFAAAVRAALESQKKVCGDIWHTEV